MSTLASSEPPGADVRSEIMTLPVPTIVEPERDSEERGRLKRRRMSSHSPRRASSPSRGHDRHSGSRYRQHHRKHHRPSSPTSPIFEDGSLHVGSEEGLKRMRKRSQPPSRQRVDGAEDDVEIRRQRSYPNLYKADRRDSKGDVQPMSLLDEGAAVVEEEVPAVQSA
ncbi:hypothetical protein T440DRAFT_404388 [Plenodomus tracheiphilus IPT5]|uniref:Uncharacterized protein n=1 Tax=Plenodomus tracheiphilus IPT5 TaxID=1408161 RepID=A0A6A7AYB7_9PLEO|nr:hypothetical protein T440DRAFT_404388 [Plenodomus tracheiphilus IPT5]